MKKIILLALMLSTAHVAKSQQKKVLFVMSAAKELPLKNGKIYSNTGVFLSELYLAYKDIKNLGYSVDFATPNGIVSSIDKESYEKKYWKGKEQYIPEGIEFVKSNGSFNQPLNLQNALSRANEYSGLVVPGGQGLMVDLINDSTMKKILTNFAKENKCVGLICHAPALLTSFSEKENPFYGYKVNSVTGIEELFIEKFVMKGKPLKRKIGKQLKQQGFKYKKGGPAKNFAVKDRMLVTSQNPFSNESFGRLFSETLKEYEASQTKR